MQLFKRSFPKNFNFWLPSLSNANFCESDCDFHNNMNFVSDAHITMVFLCLLPGHEAKLCHFLVAKLMEVFSCKREISLLMQAASS